MQKITTFLWFDNNAEEAINFYTSIFNDAKIINMTRMGTDGPVLSATFQLEGQRFMALNGGPMFKFTEAISLFVDCETQEEVDALWRTFRWWLRRPMRMAQRSIRVVVANHPAQIRRINGRQKS